MPDQKEPSARLDLASLAPAQSKPAITAIEVIALSLSLLWLIAILFLFFTLDLGESLAQSGGTGLGMIMILLAVFLPIALIWVAASVARTARVMRDEADRLQGAIAAMRETVVEQNRSASRGVKPEVEKKIDEIAQVAKHTETALVSFASRRGMDMPVSERKAALPTPPRAPGQTEDQTSLALGVPSEDLREPISVSEFIRAANFPETTEDREGFRALRLALEDRNVGPLIRSAQDMLTLMSEDGIYMDDLRPDRAKPEVWRRFAEGERGRAVSALGGIRDRSCLALTAARMKSDPIFRDTAHHFLRHFDKTFAAFAEQASDEEIAKLAETRSARAFMLLGRVTRTFE
ncbi:hypothetical protein [Tropicimonas sp. S265A]|uniref:hypothetical protein n=1 Tax=Tropicimonas sp. S265A TaxID=3415134 RepID=UPI003C7A25A9